MIKVLFKPFFKKFVGLFISMAFVSLLSITLLSTFGSTIINLRGAYEKYVTEYQDVDEQVSTGFNTREKLMSISDIEGIEEIDMRLSLDTFLKLEKKTIMSRVFSFNDKTDKIFKRFIYDKCDKNPDYVNISISKRFSDNNNIKLGSVIQLGYFGVFADFYVNEIVQTPEQIYPRVNDYIWSDNQDFGYLYMAEDQLGVGLTKLQATLIEEYNTDEEFKEFYDETMEFIKEAGIDVPDLLHVDAKTYADKYANQINIKNKKGYDAKTILEQVKERLLDLDVNVKSSSLGVNLPYRLYMENALRQLTVAAIFLPVFFYVVTMIIVGLFMNQIIKNMTPQIGVMMSIGVGKRDIISIFVLFSFLMSIVAGILGSVGGYGLNALMASVTTRTYSMPFITAALNPWIVVIAIVGLIIFAEAATFISCRAIMKISPKDAVISNESKRKQTPRWMQKVIDKSPMNVKLGLNSIAQNPKRFVVSTFSIFASIVLILLSGFFYVSKNEMINQSVNTRLNFDAQVYFSGLKDETFINEFKEQSFIKGVDDCFYTYVQAEASNGDKIYLECLGLPLENQGMVHIPDESGKGEVYIQEQGLILTRNDAIRLNAKKGDTITLNGTNVTVSDISYQYFHPVTYMSKNQLAEVAPKQYVSSFLIQLVEGEDVDQQLQEYLSNIDNQCITVFTSSLRKDLLGIFDSIDIFVYIMIGFSIGISFIILLIMSQNSLLEQQRQLSVFRAIGFTIGDISRIWTLQSVLQLLMSSIIAVPAGIGFSILLFKLCSSAGQTYPFVFSWGVTFMAIGFIALVLITTHLLAMHSIKKWNIADNTRCRE